MLQESLHNCPLDEVIVSLRDYNIFPRYGNREAWDDLLSQPLNQRRRDFLNEAAEEILNEHWPLLTASLYAEFCRTGNRSNYESLYFKRRTNLGTLVLAECLNGDGRYFDAIMDGLHLICEEYTWTLPAHAYHLGDDPLQRDDEMSVALFTCETAATLGETLFLLSDELDARTPSLTNRIRKEIEARVLKPVEEDVQRYCWSDGHNNWSPWCVSNILQAAAFTLDDRARLARLITDRLALVIDRYLEKYPKDGCCDEGPSYWGVSPGALLVFLEHLYALTGGKISVYDQPQIRRMGEFIANAHLTGDWALNFADAGPRLRPSRGTVYRYGQRVGSETMMALVRHGMRQWRADGPVDPPLGPGGNGARLLNGMTELFWGPGDEPAGELTKDRTVWYPETQVLVARESCCAGEGLILSAKGGTNAENHNHNDVGQFLIHLDGKPMIIDLGACTYTRDTFREKRYEQTNNRSSGHNAPVVDGFEQQKGWEHQAKDVSFRDADSERRLEMDLAAAYPQEAGIHELRRVMTLKADGISVSDTYAVERARQVVLNLFTPAEVEEHESCLRLGNDGVVLCLSWQGTLQNCAVTDFPITDSKLEAGWGDSLRLITLSFTIAPQTASYSLSFQKG